MTKTVRRTMFLNLYYIVVFFTYRQVMHNNNDPSDIHFCPKNAIQLGYIILCIMTYEKMYIH